MNTLVIDNGLQFTNRKLNEFPSGLNIKHRVTSVKHPQTNRRAEAANKVILGDLKKLLDGANGRWVEDLVEILWVNWCTPPPIYNT